MPPDQPQYSFLVLNLPLLYRSLFCQARPWAAWNCIFMNRAEGLYAAIRRECSDISHWQHEYSTALFKLPTISTHTEAINYTIMALEQINMSACPLNEEKSGCWIKSNTRFHLIKLYLCQHNKPWIKERHTTSCSTVTFVCDPYRTGHSLMGHYCRLSVMDEVWTKIIWADAQAPDETLGDIHSPTSETKMW